MVVMVVVWWCGGTTTLAPALSTYGISSGARTHSPSTSFRCWTEYWLDRLKRDTVYDLTVDVPPDEAAMFCFQRAQTGEAPGVLTQS